MQIVFMIEPEELIVVTIYIITFFLPLCGYAWTIPHKQGPLRAPACLTLSLAKDAECYILACFLAERFFLAFYCL